MTESRATGARPRPGESAEDRALLVRIQSGDPESFDSFVERFGSMIWAFGLRMCGHKEDAEDVFQETLVKIFTSLQTLENPGALRTWIWRVVANECRMSRRGPRDPSRALGFDDLKRPGEGEGPPPEFEDEESVSPEEAAIRGETWERVEEAVRNLPPQYRIIVLLRDFEGLSTEQVAEILDISTSNAKVRLHRARLALRKLIEGEAGEAKHDS
jgi:RNA polymerase sigma-70 factor (ECF subfamily)